MIEFPKSNSEFLKTLFGEGWGEIPVSSGKDAWGVMPAKSAVDLFMPTMPNYYCVSVFRNDGGRFRRKKEIFKRQNVFVIDDIGTKLDEDAASLLYLPPTYKLETSPGNYQWGYVIAGGCDDMRKSDALVDAVVGNSLVNPSGKDPGMAGVTRVVRLPYGANLKATVIEANGGKPFLCRLTHWAPATAYDLQTLAAAFGADLSEEALESRRTVMLSGEATPEEIEGDFILKLFRARGMIADDSRSDSGFIAVECPWAAEHTDARSEAGYRPGLGGFQCHHGHCQHRTMNDLRAWAAEAITPEEKVELARVAFSEPIDEEAVSEIVAAAQEERDESALGVALKEYVFVRAQDALGELRTGELVTRSVFNATQIEIAPAGAKAEKSSFAVFMNSWPKIAHNLIYWPGKGRIIKDRETGNSLFNTWRRGPILPYEEPVSEADLSVYFDHAQLIFPDEAHRSRFLDRMAFMLQNRGAKINSALVVVGRAQGTGKDLIVKPITRILGARNTWTLDDEALGSSFKPWLESEFIVIAELPSYHKRDFYNSLKPLIATGQDFIPVNKKFQAQYLVRNSQNYAAFTNHEDALALENRDRRFEVMATDAQPQPPSYFKRLAAAIDDEIYLSKMYRHLLDRDVSAFDPFSPPPVTEAKRAMIEHARDPVHAWLEDLFGEGGPMHGRRLIAIEEIVTRAKTSDDLAPKVKDRASDARTIGRMLADALPGTSVKKIAKLRLEPKGPPRHLWAIGPVEAFEQMVNAERFDDLKALYHSDGGAASLSPGGCRDEDEEVF